MSLRLPKALGTGAALVAIAAGLSGLALWGLFGHSPARHTVPITVLSERGPFAAAGGQQLFAATSLDALAALVDRSGAYPSRAECAHPPVRGYCWNDVQVPARTLLIALEIGPAGAVWETRLDRAELAGSTLEIIEVSTNTGSLSQLGSSSPLALAAVPLDQLPHGYLTIVVTHRFLSARNNPAPDLRTTIALR